MVRRIIPKAEARELIFTLKFYNHFFFSWFGLNPVARGEIAIRQLVILATLHYLIKDMARGDRLIRKAEKLMSKVIINNQEVAWTEKFLLAKMSFDYYAWVFCQDQFTLRLNNLQNNL